MALTGGVWPLGAAQREATQHTCMAANAAEPQEAITVSELWTAASPSQEALLLATEDVLEGPPQI